MSIGLTGRFLEGVTLWQHYWAGNTDDQGRCSGAGTGRCACQQEVCRACGCAGMKRARRECSQTFSSLTAKEHPVTASGAGQWAPPLALDQRRDGGHCQLDQEGKEIRERTCSICVTKSLGRKWRGRVNTSRAVRRIC